MNVSSKTDWRGEFGIASGGPMLFFASKAELNAPAVGDSQGHVARRAFEPTQLVLLC
jgi:hypothetical protein